MWKLLILPSNQFPIKIIENGQISVELESFYRFQSAFFQVSHVKTWSKKLKISSWCLEFRADFLPTSTLYFTLDFQLQIWTRVCILSLTPSHPQLVVQRPHTHTKEPTCAKKLRKLRQPRSVKPPKGCRFQNRPVLNFRTLETKENPIPVITMLFIFPYRWPKVFKRRVCFLILCKNGTKRDEIDQI